VVGDRARDHGGQDRLNARDLRIHIYEVLLDRGFPPTTVDIARHFRRSRGEVREALRNLKIGKTVLVHPKTEEIWMCGPFASEPTSYRVEGKRATYYANCAWDMLGIPLITNEWVNIETSCTDCGEPIRLSADPESAPPDDLVVHFLVPANRWYDDIGFT
jgi:hypothetical protein